MCIIISDRIRYIIIENKDFNHDLLELPKDLAVLTIKNSFFNSKVRFNKKIMFFTIGNTIVNPEDY